MCSGTGPRAKSQSQRLILQAERSIQGTWPKWRATSSQFVPTVSIRMLSPNSTISEEFAGFESLNTVDSVFETRLETASFTQDMKYFLNSHFRRAGIWQKSWVLLVISSSYRLV